LIRDQALTISFSHIVSLLVALTLVPTIFALIAGRARAIEAEPRVGPRGRGRSLLGWGLFVALAAPRWLVRMLGRAGRGTAPLIDKLLAPFDAGYGWVERTYPAVLRAALNRPGRVLGWSALALVAAVAAAAFLPRNLVPPAAQGEFRFNVRLPRAPPFRSRTRRWPASPGRSRRTPTSAWSTPRPARPTSPRSPARPASPTAGRSRCS